MIQIIGIDHIVLRTANKATLLRFYCDVLGCTVERETPSSIGLTQLRAGNALIDIVTVDGELGREGGAAPMNKGNNLDHFCLQIAHQPQMEILRYLEKHAVNIESFEDRYGATGYGASLYIEDPDGNRVELKPVLKA